MGVDLPARFTALDRFLRRVARVARASGSGAGLTAILRVHDELNGPACWILPQRQLPEVVLQREDLDKFPADLVFRTAIVQAEEKISRTVHDPDFRIFGNYGHFSVWPRLVLSNGKPGASVQPLEEARETDQLLELKTLYLLGIAEELAHGLQFNRFLATRGARYFVSGQMSDESPAESIHASTLQAERDVYFYLEELFGGDFIPWSVKWHHPQARVPEDDFCASDLTM